MCMHGIYSGSVALLQWCIDHAKCEKRNSLEIVQEKGGGCLAWFTFPIKFQ